MVSSASSSKPSPSFNIMIRFEVGDYLLSFYVLLLVCTRSLSTLTYIFELSREFSFLSTLSGPQDNTPLFVLCNLIVIP